MNTAQQRKQRTRLIGIVVFIALVLVSGFVFTSTGKTDDPFTNMSDIVDMRQMLADTQQGDSLPQVGDVAAGGGGSDLAIPTESASNSGMTITWSAGGEVLYDLWFICATTAVFIVFSYFIKWLVKQVPQKNRLSPANRSRTRRGDPPVL